MVPALCAWTQAIDAQRSHVFRAVWPKQATHCTKRAILKILPISLLVFPRKSMLSQQVPCSFNLQYSCKTKNEAPRLFRNTQNPSGWVELLPSLTVTFSQKL